MNHRHNASHCSRSCPADGRIKVVIIQEHLTHYRYGFFTRLRTLLSHHQIDLELIHGPSNDKRFLHHGLDWATEVRMIRLGPLYLHAAFACCWKADLLIAIQEVKYPLPLLFQILAPFRKQRFAFWGHGRNFQATDPDSAAERVKRFLAPRVDWWFAYNDLSARVVRDLGFESERITCVGNAIDTSALIQRRQEIGDEALVALRKKIDMNSSHVAVFTGGLYPTKRISFLLKAAKLVRERIPDFELLIIGDGPERPIVHEAAKTLPWIHELGPMNDHDKVPYWALASVLLMPGGVGLVILDSFALGVPIVTTDTTLHGPEIDYLNDGQNGLMVACGDSCDAYAKEVVNLLRDQERLARLQSGALKSVMHHNIETMVENFSKGILQALEFPRRSQVLSNS